MAKSTVNFTFLDPNPALNAILTGKTGTLRSFLLTNTERVQNLYQAKVAKKTGRLSASAHSYVEIRAVVKGQNRLVGVMTVGGTLPAGVWNSTKNPNPGKQFYYGVFHEFGTHSVSKAVDLSAGQQRRLEGLLRLASDRAASPAEKRLARQRAKELQAKSKTTRTRVHPAAHDMKTIVREMGSL